MNETTQFKPGRQIIRVSHFTFDPNGRKNRNKEWDGFLVGETTRGLLLVPISEYGESNDPLASTFISHPEFCADSNFEFIVKKEV